MDDWVLFTGIPDPGSDEFARLVTFCEQYRVHVLSSLPWFASEIAEQAGFSRMLSLVRSHSGIKFYIPTSREALSEKLKTPISQQFFNRIQKLTSEPRTIEIPSAWGVFVALRRIAILLAIQSGQRNNLVARRFGVTTRHLRKLRSLVSRSGGAAAIHGAAGSAAPTPVSSAPSAEHDSCNATS